MTQISPSELKKILLGAGIIESAQFEHIHQEAKRTKHSLYQLLLEKGVIRDYELGQLVASANGYPFVRLEERELSPSVLRLLPEEVARNQLAIPFAETKTDISVAMESPEHGELVHNLEKETNKKVKVYYATERDIRSILPRYRKGFAQDFALLLETHSKNAQGTQPSDPPVEELVNLILSYAYENKASDVHIEPLDESVVIRYRIDGILHEVGRFAKNIHELIVARIKIMAKLRIDEHRAAQDGELKTKDGVEIRVSIVPITEGEKVVLRLLTARGMEFALTDLGVRAEDLGKINRNIERPHGMILATGPTGSGKTTTLYAILKAINTEKINIATIEDPVEYDIEGVNQIQVNPHTNLTFALGLRAIIRQDPDIIMVGEIRDNDTAGISVNAALTGHLVLSSLHANDAATTLPRLLDMDIEPFLIASTLNLVIAQRLVRKICNHCRESYLASTDKALWEKHPQLASLFRSYSKKKLDAIRLYRGTGCSVCGHLGYQGRIGIFETLEISESIKKLVMVRASSDDIQKQAIQEGIKTMIEDGIDKALEGITTTEELVRVLKE
ncbi:MAG TPA: GspE/PulE family protein [Candidatus Paceibacterota bacterium]